MMEEIDYPLPSLARKAIANTQTNGAVLVETGLIWGSTRVRKGGVLALRSPDFAHQKQGFTPHKLHCVKYCLNKSLEF